MARLTPVAEALATVLEGAGPLAAETLSLAACAGRVLALDVAARRSQPPFPASAMDGYALRAADLAAPSARLSVIGESAAGRAFPGTVGAGEAVRIFTGAPVPRGADTVLIQEDAHRLDGGAIEASAQLPLGKNIRAAGIDFTAGEIVLERGRLLDPAALALAAAANHPALAVVRRPKVAILATGDELRLPGETPGPDDIIASNTFSTAALVNANGGEALDLGIVRDRLDEIVAAIGKARDAGADILVTLGGASVGDHDLVQKALVSEGMDLAFWKIAMRPGKPMMTGRLGAMRVLGLPGNPVSSFVCTVLFVAPLVRRLAGLADSHGPRAARLGRDLGPNDEREDYLRAAVTRTSDGLVATPFAVQDSSVLSVLAGADALLIRRPHAPAAHAGDPCEVLLLPRGYATEI